MKSRICPKCESEMKPGYPLEDPEHGTDRPTEWVSNLPILQWNILGGKFIRGERENPRRFVLGFACVKCGFVELYVITEEELKLFLEHQAKNKPPKTGHEGRI